MDFYIFRRFDIKFTISSIFPLYELGQMIHDKTYDGERGWTIKGYGYHQTDKKTGRVRNVYICQDKKEKKKRVIFEENVSAVDRKRIAPRS